MKVAKNKPAKSEMGEEYDFSAGVKGKYARRYAKGTNVVLLDADVAKVFKDSATVNAKLRALIELGSRKKAALAQPLVVREKTPRYRSK